MGDLIAAIVVTYNSEGFVNGLLDSLPAAFGNISHRTVVVDNGSVDRTADLVDERGDALLVRSTNTGFAGGINAGVAHVPEADSFLILNPDATVKPGAVEEMLRVLHQPNVGIVAPRMLESDGRLSPSLRREPTLGRAGGLSFTGLAAFAERIENPEAYRDQHVVDWAVGAALLVSRDCYAAVGGFDESYFLYSEETDFCLRARDHGWLTVYTPDAEVVHIGGGSGESATTHTMKMLNRIRIYGRRHGRVSTWGYFVVAVLTEVRRAVFGHRASWTAARAMVCPSRRPPELRAHGAILPK